MSQRQAAAIPSQRPSGYKKGWGGDTRMPPPRRGERGEERARPPDFVSVPRIQVPETLAHLFNEGRVAITPVTPVVHHPLQ